MKFATFFSFSVCVCVCITSHSAISWCSRAYLQKEVTAVWLWLWQNEFWIKERRNYWSDQLLWFLCVENTSIQSSFYHFLCLPSFFVTLFPPLVIHRHNSLPFFPVVSLIVSSSILFALHVLCLSSCAWDPVFCMATTTPYVFVCFSRFPYRMIKREWQLSRFREQAFVISFPFPSFLSLVSCCKLPPPSSTWKCTHTYTHTKNLRCCTNKLIQSFSPHICKCFLNTNKSTQTQCRCMNFTETAVSAL